MLKGRTFVNRLVCAQALRKNEEAAIISLFPQHCPNIENDFNTNFWHVQPYEKLNVAIQAQCSGPV